MIARGGFIVLVVASAAALSMTALSGAAPVEVTTSDQARTIAIRQDDRPVLTYEAGPRWALPHYLLYSPSGKALTIQQTDPFPHHRSVWFADRLKMGDGPEVDFYHDWKNLKDRNDPSKGSRHFIEPVRATPGESHDDRIAFTLEHRWIVNESIPVLDDRHEVVIHLLGEGEYLIDLTYTLTASYGDVTFTSDWTHYAWPYVRMHPQFSGEAGGTITTDDGRTGQKATNGKPARWIDYSNTVEGATEGLAILLAPAEETPRWLTREYGTFGPRRPAEHDGKPFLLKQGEALTTRVGLLVHRGDVTAGRVAQRYQAFIEDSGENRAD